MNAIEERTGISIALEGVFKWVVFPASRRDARVPIPNQYFGAFQDGTLKYRGIELRRRDTTPWVREVQLQVLKILAQADSPEGYAAYVPDVLRAVAEVKHDLRIGRVPLDQLIIHQRLSRAVEAYKTPSPAARAAIQLQAQGRQFAPGQSVDFLYARNASGVHAWELVELLEAGMVNTKRYSRILDRAMRTVLDPVRSALAQARLF
jgi:DNA polymerase-2